MSASRNYDSGRIDYLESQNASLQAKVRQKPLFMSWQFIGSASKTCALENKTVKSVPGINFQTQEAQLPVKSCCPVVLRTRGEWA